MYDKILVPIDGSETSRKALEEAVKLAELTGGQLRILHVVDALSHLKGFEASAVYLTDLLPQLLKAGRDLVEQAKREIGGQNVDTEVVESSGEAVSEVIVERAREWDAEIIVLGTHGRRGIERIVMGSDAEQVARTAHVPVLLVRHR